MDISRRRFFSSRKPVSTPPRPPWSVPEPQFTDLCSRCDDCLKACPGGLLARGPGGFPTVDFSIGGCTFCGECAHRCTTGAIAAAAVAVAPPWQFGIRIGPACLPRQGVECRVCGEACDTGAIRFRLRLGAASLPEVDDSACTGCGACIAPCPVTAVERAEHTERLRFDGSSAPAIFSSCPSPFAESA